MPEWKNNKYIHLLTPTIWNSNFKNIKQILSMPEWEDEKYQHLLTTNIWNNSYEDKYLQLLKPSIFSISTKNIINGIELLKEYGIDKYVTNKCLRFKTEFLKNLIDYLVANNIDLVT